MPWCFSSLCHYLSWDFSSLWQFLIVPSFSWLWYFWRELSNYFVERPSIHIGLMLSLWLSWAYELFGRIPQRWCANMHHIREYIISIYITGDVDFYHLVKVMSHRILHSKITIWGEIHIKVCNILFMLIFHSLILASINESTFIHLYSNIYI